MRSVFCILLGLFTSSLFAQQKHFLYPLGWRGNRIELHTISDKLKQQSCIFIAKTDSVRAMVFNKEVQLVQQFSIPRAAGEDLLGGFFKDGKVYLFMENARYDKLHKWVLNMATGSTEERLFSFELQKEKIIDRISGGDHFLYFTARKRSSEFIVYDFRSDTGFTTLRHTFDEELWSAITKSRGVLGRDMNIEKVDTEGECNVEAAVACNKIYARNDTLYLLTNLEKGITHVYGFDLLNQQVFTRSITHYGAGYDLEREATISENSYLLSNTLYYVQASPDSLCLQVTDFNSGQPIKTYLASRNENITFKNSPIIQEGGAYDFGDKRELGKTKQLLRKMSNGDALVMATPENSNQVQVVVGSYARVSSGSGGGGMWMGAGAPGSPSVYIPSGGFSRNTWTKSARFKTLLNVQNGEHMEGNPANTINERIAYYTGGIKIPREGENLFMTNGHYYFAYWDTHERRLVILKF